MARGLEIVDRNVKLQVEMIEDLLDLSRIVSGKLRLDFDRVDVTALGSMLVEGAQPVARSRQLRLEIDAREPLFVNGDARRLHQCLSNLVANAMKFTPAGGSVTLRIEQKGSCVVLTLADTGIGIDPERLPFIFDTFYQVDTSATRAHSGLGLGLSIVRHLIELHHGGITATSAGPGRGTTFTMTLPLIDAAGSDLAAHPSAAAPEPSALAGARILVVDDEIDTRVTLRAILEQSGAEVVAVGSAEDALRALADGRPDVLLSDLAMPGADGYELMQQIRALDSCRGLPAAALTAHAGPEIRARALAAGFRAHLEKPVEPSVLTATLARLLHDHAGA
jgi:CheY-like chemotaxis protein